MDATSSPLDHALEQLHGVLQSSAGHHPNHSTVMVAQASSALLEDDLLGLRV